MSAPSGNKSLSPENEQHPQCTFAQAKTIFSLQVTSPFVVSLCSMFVSVIILFHPAVTVDQIARLNWGIKLLFLSPENAF